MKKEKTEFSIEDFKNGRIDEEYMDDIVIDEVTYIKSFRNRYCKLCLINKNQRSINFR